tara:strand:- start:352 stop:498 length:147 start_codon:yes stop_codon:yes gene_type:complete
MKKVIVLLGILFVTGCAGRIYLDATLPNDKDVDIRITTNTEPKEIIVN